MKILEVLLEEEENLSKMITLLRDSLKNAPVGNLRISHSGRNVQYYYRPCKIKIKESTKAQPEKNESKQIQSSQNKEIHESRDDLNRMRLVNSSISEMEASYLERAVDNAQFERGIYIRKNDKKLVCDLAQRDYDTSLLKVLENRINHVRELIDLYRRHEVEQVYEMLNFHRKEIVNPRIITDEKYAEQWCNVRYEGKLFAEGTAVIYTNRGERVRSKSEKIIADMLLQKGVFYRYEAPVILRGIGTIYPDFTILNVKKREEVYWEHLGMMDQKDYCERALRKIEMYQRNGIILGKRLIITYETLQHPLETQMIERNIVRVRESMKKSL